MTVWKATIAAACLSLSFAAETTAGTPELSRSTSQAIASVFGRSELSWSDTVRFRIRNLAAVPGAPPTADYAKPFVEGGVVIVHVLVPQAASRVALFIDGNKQPLAGVYAPGPSRGLGSIKLGGRADNDCNGHYHAVVVQEIQGELLASRVAFRTVVADCDQR